ncbi:MAG: hypothetical protein IIY88_06870 [Eubacterium sp.]|nr:hypothetical protein [Eubacterium sp.]
MENKTVWEKYTKKQVKECDAFCKNYIDFLSNAKTERECTDLIVKELKAAGYRDIDELIDSGAKLKPGDKVYRVNMKKSVIMFNIGTDPISDGMNILGAHIDSPRLDIKQNPLYQDGGFAYLDTHYYGGIKKYQWVTIPLAIHGVFVKKDGEVVPVVVGEDPADPVLFVSDLLVHLSQEQLAKKGAVVVEGEALDVIVGNKPIVIDKKSARKDKDSESAKNAGEAVKQGVLDVLKEKYGVEEDDFISAELEVVPAGRAREAGLDRSMILAYGHDDKVCAYTSYRAMIDVPSVKRTACCILVDKEEIGSYGATGMESMFFENTVAELIRMLDENKD